MNGDTAPLKVNADNAVSDAVRDFTGNDHNMATTNIPIGLESILTAFEAGGEDSGASKTAICGVFKMCRHVLTINGGVESHVHHLQR